MRVQVALVLATLAVGCGGSPAPDDASSPIDARPRDARASEEDAMSDPDAMPDPDVDGGPPIAPRTAFVYVGQNGGDLVVLALDLASGALTERSRARTGDLPAFAAVAPSGRALYVAVEPMGRIAARAIAPGTGATSSLGSARSSGGGSPAHVSVDRSGRWALVANYGGGTVAVLPIGADGSLGDAVDVESPGANAHAIEVDPSNRFALVPCLGTDRVEVFAFDATTGALEAQADHATARGAGPRHLAFDRTGEHVYVNNESDSTIDVLDFDLEGGGLSHRQTLSTLPDTFSGSNTTAEILVHPAGHTVYVSNRGHDSIAVFEVQGDGSLVARGHAMLGARMPRSMAIDPSGTFLVAGALADDRLVRFRIGADGALTSLGATALDAGPYFVGIFAIPDA